MFVVGHVLSGDAKILGKRPLRESVANAQEIRPPMVCRLPLRTVRILDSFTALRSLLQYIIFIITYYIGQGREFLSFGKITGFVFRAF